MSYKPMMEFSQRQRNGSYFAGNGLRFGTEAEAEAQAKDLMSRWFVPVGYRIDSSDDKVNYSWDFDLFKTTLLSATESK